MFDSTCAWQYPPSSAFRPGALARAAAAGLTERNLVFAAATIGLGAATAIVLSALATAF